MKFVVFSLGCKVNQYESHSMISLLREKGYEADDKLEKADFYIINTCSVTGEADKKSRQAVARVLKFNPNAKVFICGCSSQNNPLPYMEKDNVFLVGGASNKVGFVYKILDMIKENNFDKQQEILPLPKDYEDDLLPALPKSRGVIKVQDGCNNFCSYCIVPYLRGRSRSRSIKSIVDEAEKTAKTTSEIVITGINLSDYGTDIGSSLTELVLALGNIPIRKRFGSLECSCLTHDFLSAMRKSGFCDSFHLSLQSGCNKILKIMNRHYTTEQFYEKVELIRHYFPNAGITTDIITGFPTETEEDFNETVEFVKKVNFLDVHVFPYSEREGTVATKLAMVDKHIRSERANYLIGVAKKLKHEHLSKQFGRTSEVFIEASEGEYNVGYTSNYIKVYTKTPLLTYAKHMLLEPYLDGVKAEKI